MFSPPANRILAHSQGASLKSMLVFVGARGGVGFSRTRRGGSLPLPDYPAPGGLPQFPGVPQDRGPAPEPAEMGFTKGDDRRLAMNEHAVVIAGGGPTGLM